MRIQSEPPVGPNLPISDITASSTRLFFLLTEFLSIFLLMFLIVTLHVSLSFFFIFIAHSFKTTTITTFFFNYFIVVSVTT